MGKGDKSGSRSSSAMDNHLQVMRNNFRKVSFADLINGTIDPSKMSEPELRSLAACVNIAYEDLPEFLNQMKSDNPVSYTHLTLPTIYSV